MKNLLALVAAVGLATSGLGAGNLTIKNFDADLATVYVNDEPTTNGQVVAVTGESVTIELKDFRNDYYFRFAPDTQTDRQLAFASWETGSKLVPAECAMQNPATFEVSGNLTVTPNVDVKGYKWVSENGTSAANQFLKWSFKSKTDATRTIALSKCGGNLVGATTSELLLDCVQRVEYNGKNYTITSLGSADCMTGSCTYGAYLPRLFNSFASNVMRNAGANDCLNELIGIADASVTSVGGNAFNSKNCNFQGPVGDFAPTTLQTVDTGGYYGRNGMTGVMVLDHIKSLAKNSFFNCSGLTGLSMPSPSLATIGDAAFSGCSGIREVSLNASGLTSASTSAFGSTVTNFIFAGATPASIAPVENLMAAHSKIPADGTHTVWMTIDPTEASWWAVTSEPTETEVAAGLPTGCLGVFVTSSGTRKAWVVSDVEAASQTLVETDMTKPGNTGYTTHGGLKAGDPLVLTAPAGMTKCEMQHLENGKWKTFDTKSGSSVAYTHDGQLTRVVWGVDGVSLSVTAKGYKGQCSIERKSGSEVAPGIYSPGSEVWITAIGSDERPRSVLSAWSGDVPAGQETNEVLKLTLTEKTEVTALFRPLEWVYDPETTKITDGEYVSSARIGDIVDRGMTFEGFACADYSLWLDFSLPICNPEDPGNDYWITSVTAANNKTWRRVRFGEHINSLPNSMFSTSMALEEVEGFGKTTITSLPKLFFYSTGTLPLRNKTYEAEDFFPVTLRTIGANAFTDGPALVGTLRHYFSDISECGGLRCGSVTNFEFLSEEVTRFELSGVTAPNSVLFASTNLTSATKGGTPGTLKHLVFLAHAPTVGALDNILFNVPSYGMVIHASKYAPGWKALNAKFTDAELETKPEGAWGVYRSTLQSDKRFFIVHQDSPYGKAPGLAIILR